MTAWPEKMPATSSGGVFLLFSRYWGLFAPYRTPDLARNAAEPGCPHERPRWLDGPQRRAAVVNWRPAGVGSVHLTTHFVLVTPTAGVSGFIPDGLPLLVR